MSKKEVESRVRALVDLAAEHGESKVAVAMIMREINIAQFDGYDQGYADHAGGKPALTERVERW